MPENTIPHHEKSFLRSLALSTQPILTKLAHGSAPFISTFLLIHLSAPVLANLGGSSLSSQVMILGREYYQTSFGEKYLVLAPLFIHPLSGIFKRLLAPAPARRLSSILSITGYTAVAFVSMHFLVHRTFPADPAPPIFSVGPSELDYEYVKFALSEWPWRSWLGYVGLTACIAWHATEGMKIIWNTWLRKAFGPFKGGARSRSMTAFAVVLPVVSGLFMISREPVAAFTSQLTRFHAALSKSLVYKI